MTKTAEAILPSIDIKIIRKQFPILNRTVKGKPLVYLDNAATTQKPQVVIDALVNYYSNYNANIHRGIHTLAEEATAAFESTRDAIQQFIHASAREEIIFTRGTTESINLVAYTWGRKKY
ncbi:MAG: aminotransferase class V-fold PLP-dependent enzyme [Ferruginibacter sp.]